VNLDEVHYTRCDGNDLAYVVVGEGPPDFVLVPGMLGHLEFHDEMPFYREFGARLPRLGRFITFDRRGSGLSGGMPLGPVEERMDDIRAVMDATGSASATLVTGGDAGPLALLYAASSPERVDRLVLYDTAARVLRDDDFPHGAEPDFVERFIGLIRSSWGTGLPSLAATAGITDRATATRMFARWERNIATPSVAAELVVRYTQADVRDALPLVSAPTLVLQAPDDPSCSVEMGAYLAEHIPMATLQRVRGCGRHQSLDPAWAHEMVDLTESWLTGAAPATQRADRLLATVLFTDIADSTEQASAAGDAAWRRMLAEHDALARTTVESRSGRVVKTTGDGVLATFDGPGRALDAALALVRSAAGLGLTIRAGLHTGEVEVRGDDVGGLAVHLAARIEADADPGSVHVSSTVADLVIGSDHRLTSLGHRRFKGMDREWEVFVAGS